MSDHHPLDVWPLPRDQKPMFINEPWLIDDSIYYESIVAHHVHSHGENKAKIVKSAPSFPKSRSMISCGL